MIETNKLTESATFRLDPVCGSQVKIFMVADLDDIHMVEL